MVRLEKSINEGAKTENPVLLNPSKIDTKMSTAEFLKNETTLLPSANRRENITTKNIDSENKDVTVFNSTKNNQNLEKFSTTENDLLTSLDSVNDNVVIENDVNENLGKRDTSQIDQRKLKKQDLEELPPDKGLLQNDLNTDNSEESILRNRHSNAFAKNYETNLQEYNLNENNTNTQNIIPSIIYSDTEKVEDEYTRNCTEILENMDTANKSRKSEDFMKTTGDIQKFKKNREFAKKFLINSSKSSIDDDQNYDFDKSDPYKILDENTDLKTEVYDKNTSANEQNLIREYTSTDITEMDKNQKTVEDQLNFYENDQSRIDQSAASKDAVVDKTIEDETTNSVEYKPELRWPDAIVQLFLHIGCVYGFYLLLTRAKFYTVLWAAATVIVSGFGITAGAHRLWSHRSYKATWPLRAILIFLFTITGQRDAYTWALDHRVHHKYSESDSDPHNAKRGFFFAHVGWLVLTPHPDVIMRRKQVDMSDLEADPIVMWQKKYYIPLFALLAIGLPVLGPWYLWEENLWVSFWVNFNFRFCVTLNIAFFVNSVAHMWGQKPYDRNISPVENLGVAIAALGEGWHNYHHVFPYDYKTGELGGYTFNPTTGFIDFFAKFGWAYDRKSVSQRMILRRAMRSGDGSYLLDPHAERTQIWGYGDTDIDPQDQNDLLNNGQLNDHEKDD